MIAIKNGAPSKDVIAPTGNAEPLPILRDNVSAMRSKRLPLSADIGIANRWSCPNSFLVTCGHIIPTNPIIPKNDTHTAVIIDANNIEQKRNNST